MRLSELFRRTVVICALAVAFASPAQEPGSSSAGWRETTIEASHAGGENLFYPSGAVSSPITFPVTLIVPEGAGPEERFPLLICVPQFRVVSKSLQQRLASERRWVIATCPASAFSGAGFPIHRLLAAYDTIIREFPIAEGARWVITNGHDASPAVAAALVRQRPDIRGFFLIDGDIPSPKGSGAPMPFEWFQNRSFPLFIAHAHIWRADRPNQQDGFFNPRFGPPPPKTEISDFLMEGRSWEPAADPWVLRTLDWIEQRTWATIPVDPGSLSAVRRFLLRRVGALADPEMDPLKAPDVARELGAIASRWGVADPPDAPGLFSGLEARAAELAAGDAYRTATQAAGEFAKLRQAELREAGGRVSPMVLQGFQRRYGELARRFPGTAAGAAAAGREAALSQPSPAAPGPAATPGPAPKAPQPPRSTSGVAGVAGGPPPRSPSVAPPPTPAPPNPVMARNSPVSAEPAPVDLPPGQWQNLKIQHPGGETLPTGTRTVPSNGQIAVRLPTGGDATRAGALVFLCGAWRREDFDAWADARGLVLAHYNGNMDIQTHSMGILLSAIDSLNRRLNLPEEFRIMVATHQAAAGVSWASRMSRPSFASLFFWRRQLGLPKARFFTGWNLPQRLVPLRVVNALPPGLYDDPAFAELRAVAGDRIVLRFTEYTIDQNEAPRPESVLELLDGLHAEALQVCRPTPKLSPIARDLITARLGALAVPEQVPSALALAVLAEDATRWKLAEDPAGRAAADRIGALLAERMTDPVAAREVAARRAFLAAEEYAVTQLTPAKKPTPLMFAAAVRRFRTAATEFAGTKYGAEAARRAAELEPRAR